MALYDVRTVTATTDAETIGDNKVICQSVEITGAFSSKNNGSMIQSITILDETTTGPAVDVVFSTSNTAISDDEGKAVGEDVADLDDMLANVVGHVSVVAGDYTNLIDSSIATKSNINLVVKGDGSSNSLYMHIINRSGGNWVATATDNMRVKIGFVKNC